MNDAEEVGFDREHLHPDYARPWKFLHENPVKRASPGVGLGPAGNAAFRPPASRGEEAEGTVFDRPVRMRPWRFPARGTACGLSASLLPRALACFSLSLPAFSLPRGPLALPAGGEPRSRFLRGGLQLRHLLEHPGLPYPG